ncbi:winged helix-turn-helix transcriptional regulator [Vibrio sp. S17_S38]|uniref:ArsR/SmtB family transcription factor n=1 Tax=Vibrio sp. S17_S38 TaxID=2720229 RepID=UPI0016805709|nr:winged helix-turn-helix domain-containing protein [Vibrio sp. S17_S38]MBD1573306.1 winged helix-turn-helix transcriptional regulator [Vibrio sp. S17_S38]
MIKACSSTNQQAFQVNTDDLARELQFSKLAKALSHPARVRILTILLRLDRLDGCLNSDLVSQLGLAQSTVSEHLRILKVAKLISAEPIPPKMCYRINRATLNEFSHLFDDFNN